MFKVKQRKGKSYSDMRVRMKTLQKEADIEDITADDLVCHIMLAACNDSDLLQEMMKVENMTEVKLHHATMHAYSVVFTEQITKCLS